MASSRSDLVWLITGTSSGLGKQFALEALGRGDKVIATARGQLSKLNDLKDKGAETLVLDVTSPLEELHKTAAAAVEIYGRIDVLVNNAGYILVGAVEENTPEETEHQFRTNVFGGLNVARSFLPYMRERKTGTIVWLGSIGGWRTAPYAGLYCATKWTLRGISYSLHEEIAPLGLRSICVDFGYFRTSFLSEGQRAPAVSRIADYQAVANATESSFQAYNGKQPGDPAKGAKAVVDIVHGTGSAEGKPFPLGVLLGSDAHQIGVSHIQKFSQLIEEWKDVSVSTDFPK
ncbi:short chain dehydrogenase [Coprinopsis marcescibilis]|uniref:Short chain dehydrogenase n=1 Tax=Coprinopsis marcescibilis TaxID=230819 RepID=A0A5C3KDH1_COPMA|nr:short chain dehydrogenase [Coprinopsis marcescibilis]